MLSKPIVRGLIAGLLLGFVVGYLVFHGTSGGGEGSAAEVAKLRHQLEATRKERDGLKANLDDFQHVAERMTEAFNTLEERFRALEGRLSGGEPDAPDREAPTPAEAP